MIMILFAILSSGIAYSIYYHLIKEIGPTATLSAMFIMPLFGILWGKLFLGEAIYIQMIIGSCIILAGTYLVVFKQPVFKCIKIWVRQFVFNIINQGRQKGV